VLEETGETVEDGTKNQDAGQFDAEAAHRARLIDAGELLAGVVHEIKNPLAVIQGYVQLLHDRSDAGDDQRDLSLVLEEARRVGVLIDDMLTYTKRECEATETIDLQKVINSAVNLSTHDMRQAGVVLVATMPDRPVLVKGSYNAFLQVVMNVLRNARQSLEEGETVRRGITVVFSEGEDGFPLLTIGNNGPGIPADVAERIFDPFFTTRGQGEGCGIGLSFCQENLKRFGGEITLASREDSNVAFCMRFPPV